jgi:uncharacterized membrane protein
LDKRQAAAVALRHIMLNAESGKEKGVDPCLNKVVSYALAFCAAAFLLNWGARLLREVWPVLVIAGLVVLTIVIYIRLRKYNDQNNRY